MDFDFNFGVFGQTQGPTDGHDHFIQMRSRTLKGETRQKVKDMKPTTRDGSGLRVTKQKPPEMVPANTDEARQRFNKIKIRT